MSDGSSGHEIERLIQLLARLPERVSEGEKAVGVGG